MTPTEPGEDEPTAEEAIDEAIATLEEAYPSADTPDGATGIDALAAALSADRVGLARDAAQLLTMLAERFPDEVAPVAGDLADALDADDEALRGHALRGLGYVSTSRPEAVEPTVKALVELLDEGGDLVGNATWTLANIAGTSPEAVEPIVPRFVEFLEFGDDEVHRHAARGVAAVAGAYPDEVRAAVPRLLDLLASTAVYRQVGRALASMALVFETAVVEGLFDRLQPGRPVLREHAAWTLVPLAESSPDLLWDRWPELVDLVRNDEDYQVKNAAAATLAALAVHRPDDELLDGLVGLLDHVDPFVRRYGCFALGDVAVATQNPTVLRALESAREDELEAVGELAEQQLVDVAAEHPTAIEEISPDLVDAVDGGS